MSEVNYEELPKTGILTIDGKRTKLHDIDAHKLIDSLQSENEELNEKLENFKNDLDNRIAQEVSSIYSDIKFEVKDSYEELEKISKELEAITDPDLKVEELRKISFRIFLIPHVHTDEDGNITTVGSDTYDEYIYSNGKWEKVGNTDINLGEYVTKEDTEAAIKEVTDAIDVIQSSYITYNEENEELVITTKNVLTGDKFKKLPIKETKYETKEDGTKVVAADDTWFTDIKAEELEQATPENPVHVAFTSPSELVSLSKMVNDTESKLDTSVISITLNNDIDMSEADWTPIGEANIDTSKVSQIYFATEADFGNNIFHGVFDGNNRVISGLKMKEAKAEIGTMNDCGYGLFGILGNGSTVKNVTIENPVIDLGDSKMSGLIVGYIPKCNDPSKITTIENCHVTGHIELKSNYGLGCIVGRIEGGSAGIVIRNCSVTADEGSFIECPITDSFSMLGGIIGALYSNNSKNLIENCKVTGLKIIAGSEGVGGIAGFIETGTVKNCKVIDCEIYNKQPANTNNYYAEMIGVGALVGEIDSSIKVTTKPTGYEIKVNLESNAVSNTSVIINKDFSNIGSADKITLDVEGFPAWESWSVIGCPRNVEHIDPTPFVNITGNTWANLRSQISVSKEAI